MGGVNCVTPIDFKRAIELPLVKDWVYLIREEIIIGEGIIEFCKISRGCARIIGETLNTFDLL